MRTPLVTEDEYDALHDRLCACGTPASALSCPLAVGIVGERCCQGCPDCLGIGVREQIEAMQADILKVVALCEEFETSGRLGAVAGYRHSTAIRDVLVDYWAKQKPQPPVENEVNGSVGNAGSRLPE